MAPAVTRQGDLCRAAQPLGGQPRSHAGLCTLTHLQCECWAPSTLQVFESSPAPLRGHPGKESQPRRVPTGSLSPWATVCPTQGTESQNHPGPPGLPGAGGCTLPSCPVPTPLPTSDGGVPLRSHMPVPISRSPTPHVALGSLRGSAATANPRSPVSNFQLGACMHGTPAAPHEPHGLTGRPQCSHLSGLCDPRTIEVSLAPLRCCACRGVL